MSGVMLIRHLNWMDNPGLQREFRNRVSVAKDWRKKLDRMIQVKKDCTYYGLDFNRVHVLNGAVKLVQDEDCD